MPQKDTENKRMNLKSHSHCWEKENPPCGLHHGTGSRCCLCEERQEKPQEPMEESHATEEGYCCACEYDLAVFEEEIRNARYQERERIREMIETKLRNDPKNPVLIAGLEYVLSTLQEEEE